MFLLFQMVGWRWGWWKDSKRIKNTGGIYGWYSGETKCKIVKMFIFVRYDLICLWQFIVIISALH